MTVPTGTLRAIRPVQLGGGGLHGASECAGEGRPGGWTGCDHSIERFRHPVRTDIRKEPRDKAAGWQGARTDEQGTEEELARVDGRRHGLPPHLPYSYWLMNAKACPRST